MDRALIITARGYPRLPHAVSVGKDNRLSRSGGRRLSGHLLVVVVLLLALRLGAIERRIVMLLEALVLLPEMKIAGQ